MMEVSIACALFIKCIYCYLPPPGGAAICLAIYSLCGSLLSAAAGPASSSRIRADQPWRVVVSKIAKSLW